MKEQITLLAQGKQANHPLRLIVNPQEILMSLAVGQNYKGEIALQEEGREPMKGLLYSSHRRVHLFTEQFAAAAVTAQYEVNVDGLNPGDQITGSFYLVTNGGEKEIPYRFEMTVPVGRTAYERIRTIEAFADLARQEFDVALAIFENSSFLTLPFMQQPAFAALYHGLYGHGERRGALEEFLTGCGVKEQIRLSVDEKKRYLSDPQEDVFDSIRIEKNTWGAVNARVESDASFIELESRLVTEDSFEENQCQLRYTVHLSMLHGGTNYGRITIATAYQRFTIEVTVRQTEGAAERRRRREYRDAYQRFFRYYVEMRARDFRSNLLVNSMLTELARLRDSFDTPDILQLFHIEVYLMAGQREKAGLLLADIKERVLAKRREEIDAYCYYYYLKSLYSESEEDKEQLVRILHFYYEGEYPSQAIYFLLLLVDEAKQENPLATMEEMRVLFERGCRSPFLYLAVCRMVAAQPLLLSRLGAFELQALLFGAKKGLISRELAVRIALLSEEERTFRPSYYRLLTMLAERYEDTELVAAVCRVLIQGSRKSPEYFWWYEMGVGLDVRLTRLYEYYLYSLPEDREGELPQEIYLYFSYTNTLDDRSRAMLYDNVLTHFEPGSSVYESFARQMEDFAREQIFAGNMSRQLARIYEKMIPVGMVDEKLAAAFARLLYGTQISCENPAWEQVVVSYEEWKREDSAVLKDGKAVMALYSDRCRVLFQDAYGNRYAGGVYSSRRLMEEPELEERCYELCPDDACLQIHRCRRAMDQNRGDEEALELYEQVLGQSSLRGLFSRQLTARIVAGTLTGNKREIPESEEAGETAAPSEENALYGMPPESEADPMFSGERAVGSRRSEAPEWSSRGARLLRLNDKYASHEDVLAMTEALIEENFCDRAFTMIERYGYEELKPSSLLKLCSRVCVEQLFGRNTLLLQACYSCMEKRRSDDVILEYLCHYYNGSSEQMLRLLLKARQYHVELYDLPERLLGQMLFSGWREGLCEAFAAYEMGGTMDDTLVRAYLTQRCYDFFTADVGAEQAVFGYVEQLLSRGWVPFICEIAFCRYISLQTERSEQQTELCMEIVRTCCERGMVFDFFRAFAGESGYPASLRGKAVVSWRTSAGERMRIRYRVLPDCEEYQMEILPHMYEGYFSKCFTAFYGERIEYEIYAERPEGLTKIGQGQILPDAKQQGGDRLGRLNHILFAMDTMEEASLKKEMRSYGVTEMLLDHYFEKL